MKKKVRISIFGLFIGLLFSVFLTSDVEAATNDMYRLYNPNSGEHFYTANTYERDVLKRVGWNDEGIGWYAPTNGDPVYRMYNPNAGDHHYTPHKFERDHLVKVGWRDEGIGWYSDKNKTIPLYRAYNPNAKAGSHNYTVSKAEQNNLIKVGWKNENIAWYGAKRDSTPPVPTVSKKELQELYDQVKNTNKGTYIEATWKTFQDALSNAKSVLDNGKATQEQVNSAKDVLQTAFNELEREPEVKTFIATAGANGSISGTVNGDYSEGTQIEVTAEPASGYRFKEWTTTTGLPSSIDTNSATISFDMPTNAVTLVAEFEKVYQIGDYYPEPNDPSTAIGVVFEVSDGGSHGKIVSLDQTIAKQWSDSQNTSMLGTTSDDGLTNMRLIATYINDNNKSWSNFPIFDWIHNTKNGGNSDYQNTNPIPQWYLPAKYELQSLFCAYNGKPAEVWETWYDAPSWGANDSSANAAFNSKLTIAGGTQLNPTTYRTSSEDGTGAYCVDFSSGNLIGWVKDYRDHLSSLAIAKF